MAADEEHDGPEPEDRWGRRTVRAAPRPADAGDTRREGSAGTGHGPATSPGGSPPGGRSVFDPPLDRFEEGCELGRGGMGRVVEARDRALARPVAIKHLLAHTTTDLARFEREVRITARLQHPGVVPILDVGRDADGQPFYIMRKIDGEPLSTRVERAQTVRDRLALVPAFLGAVDAAAYAHAQGIIHRDIKPWNILLGPFGEALLIDWGIARDLGDTTPEAEGGGGAEEADPAERLTRVGFAYGTPGFMAPEQARGEEVDRRADVYSLGATLYFILSGTLPVTRDPTAAIVRIAAGEGPDLERIPEQVPVELAAITSKALAADPAARYPDAGELATDLRRFLAGQLVAAHPYTALERILRWVRRHRLAAGTIVAAILAVSVVATVSFRRVVDERDRVRVARQLAEARAEELLVDRARALVAVDPTSALALLRRLPRDSDAWPTARAIVRAAVAGGYERAIQAHAGMVYAVAVGPDGRVATSGSDRVIRIHDVARGISTELAELGVRELGWLDARRLGYVEIASGDRRAVGIVDLESRTTRVVSETAEQAVFSEGRVYVRSGGTVTAYDADGEATVLATKGAVAIAASAGRLVIAGSDRLLVVEAAGVRERAISSEAPVRTVTISPRGDRVAASVPGAILEWTVAGDAAPRRWPRPTTHVGGMGYVGDTLHAWSGDGTGVVSLAGDVARNVWLVRGQPLPIATFDGGAALATREGALAYTDQLGTFELPHRAIDLNVIEAAPGGRQVFLGTTAGELLIVELAAVRPEIVAAPPGTLPLAVSPRHLAYQHRPDGSSPSTVPIPLANLAVVDLATGERTDLGPVGFAPSVWLGQRQVLAVSGPPPRKLRSWSFDGTPDLEIDDLSLAALGHDRGGASIYYATTAGAFIELPFERAGAPRKLGEFPPRDDGDRKLAQIVRTNTRERGILIGLLREPGSVPPTRFMWFEDGTGHELDLPLEGWLDVDGPMADGSWWVVQDFTRLWRIPRGGAPIAVPLPHEIKHVLSYRDRIWALSATSKLLYVLAPDGSVLKTIALPGLISRFVATRTSILLVAPGGLVVASPAANVRFTLPVPSGTLGHVVSRDGTTVAALATSATSGTPVLAIWRDPVPADPRQVAAYLERLTNARLELGSDAVTWDAPVSAP